MKKKIKILTTGIIKAYGFIHGPVLTPYYEDVDVIFKLVAGGVKVVEVTDDNKEIELTVSNIHDDNSSKARTERENVVKAKEEAERKAKEEAELQKMIEEEEKKKKKEAEEAEKARVEAVNDVIVSDEKPVESSNNFNKKNKK